MKTKFNTPLAVTFGLLAFSFSGDAYGGAGDEDKATGDGGEGELFLGGPGVGLSHKKIDELPFAEDKDLGKYYKFVLTGIEVQCDADGVPGSFPYDGFMWDSRKRDNAGHGNNCDGVDLDNGGASMEGQDSDPTIDDECIGILGGDVSGVSAPGLAPAGTVQGWWNMWAFVNDDRVGDLTFSTAALNHQSDILQLFLSTPKVYREMDIVLKWEGDGNTHDPDGHFYILGSAIEEPPVPIGELSFSQNTYVEGTSPSFSWNVIRE